MTNKIRTRFYCGLVEKDGTPITKNVYLAVMNKHFTGYTVYPASGYWKGEPEPCIVVEIIRDTTLNTLLFQIGEELRQAGNQSAVLYTQEEVTAGFIEREVHDN